MTNVCESTRLSLVDFVDVVIVTHNSQRTIGKCIDSVRERLPGAKVIVIDSGSEDNSVDVAIRSGASLVHKIQNLGFGVACNVGVNCGKAPWILLLNPDAVLRSFDTDILQRTADVFVPRWVSEDGVMHRNVFYFPTLLGDVLGEFMAARYRRYPLPEENSWVSGACLLIRREVYERIGGFDPDFFLFREDTDLCLRLRKAGCTFTGAEFTFVHSGGESTQANPDARSLARMHSRLVYARKHYGLFGYLLICFAVMTGSLLKFLVSLVGRKRSPTPYIMALGLVTRYWALPPTKMKAAWLHAIRARGSRK